MPPLLYQGLLDLHGQLFGSNGGELLGHLPANDYLESVRTQTAEAIEALALVAREPIPLRQVHRKSWS